LVFSRPGIGGCGRLCLIQITIFALLLDGWYELEVRLENEGGGVYKLPNIIGYIIFDSQHVAIVRRYAISCFRSWPYESKS
jgi:hypothetical protein